MRALLLVAAALLAPAASAAAAPPLTFGITPAGEAGALGPTVPPVPDDPPRTLAALQRLRPPGAPFVLRLNRFFWSEGQAGIDRFAALARRYTRAGFRVELQLRYHPRPEQVGDTRAWLAFVRAGRRHLRPQPPRGRAAGDQRGQLHHLAGLLRRRLRGRARRAHRGCRGRARPGRAARLPAAPHRLQLVLPHRPGQRGRVLGLPARPRRARVRAMPSTGWGSTPTRAPCSRPRSRPAATARPWSRRCARCAATCAASASGAPRRSTWRRTAGRRSRRPAPRPSRRRRCGRWSRAVDAERGPLHVTDYRWFDLRDHRTASTNFQHHYGLLRDDYSPKPAYGAYRRLVAALSRRRRQRARPRRAAQNNVGSAGSSAASGSRQRSPSWSGSLT